AAEPAPRKKFFCPAPESIWPEERSFPVVSCRHHYSNQVGGRAGRPRRQSRSLPGRGRCRADLWTVRATVKRPGQGQHIAPSAFRLCCPPCSGSRLIEAPWNKKVKDGLGTRPASLQKSYELKPETPVAPPAS